MTPGISRRVYRTSGSTPAPFLAALSLLLLWIVWSFTWIPSSVVSPASGSIRIGYAPQAPFSLRAPNGEGTGESPEVARYVLSRLGYRDIEWVETESGLLIPELLAGRFDMIAAGMFITPERARQVRFSRPTLQLHESLLVGGGNPKRIHSYAEFAHHPELRLAVLDGAIEVEIARLLGISNQQIVSLPDVQTAMVALESGKADALALTAPSVRNLSSTLATAGLEVATPFEEPAVGGTRLVGYSGFAFRPEDTRLANQVDAQLAGFLGTREHLRLIGVYGFGRDDLPGTAKLE